MRRDGRLVSNMSSRVGADFAVSGLEPGVVYTVLVYASNEKGRSVETATLTVSTLGHGTTQHHRIETGSPLYLLETILFVIVIVSLVLGSTIGVMLRRRKKRKQKSSSPLQSTDSELDKSMAQLLTVTPSIEDDRNPDLIPQSNEADFTALTSVVNADFIPESNVQQWEVTLTPAVEYHTVPTQFDPEMTGRWLVGGPVSWPKLNPQPVLLSTTNDLRPSFVLKQHAETQTPSGHKESAV
ncbi:hypothetical protein LSTR_LSTR007404 [Laodelphax striatellus]|uniref:Fibronectin type-III domain-containing protein n=1 Tax=Laodelphax striatellus TaxID=195883 RepID=A0A482XNY1_LAOST|nr:hypothetical protein LSTR_LSTR007404 [Laodelphax striatellus]